MPRKKGMRIGEAGREWARKQGILDDRYTKPLNGVVAKEKRRLEAKKKK